MKGFCKMKCSYKTQNTCCKLIEFDLNGDIVTNVQFLGGGCPGNLQALPKLVEGMTVKEIENKLSGITCGIRGTSCADQLSKAVTKSYEESKQNV